MLNFSKNIKKPLQNKKIFDTIWIMLCWFLYIYKLIVRFIGLTQTLFKIINFKFVCTVILCMFFIKAHAEDSLDNILVIKTVDHLALDETLKGFEREILKVYPKTKIMVESCQNNGALASQIVAKYLDRVKYVVTLGTMASQVMANNLVRFTQVDKKNSMFFSSVSFPKESGLTQHSLYGKNLFGVSNYAPTARHLEILNGIFIDLKMEERNLGILYSNGEVNSNHMVAEFVREVKNCGDRKIQLHTQSVNDLADVKQALQMLIKKNCKIILVSQDNFLLTCVPIIAKECKEARVLFVVTDEAYILGGARVGPLMALGVDQTLVGEVTAQMLIDRALDRVPQEFTKFVCENRVTVSAHMAQELGLNFVNCLSDAVDKDAKTIVIPHKLIE